MSGNLLDGVTPTLKNGATDLGNGEYQLAAYDADSSKHQDQIVFDIADQAALTENQTVGISFAVNGASAATNLVRALVKYADSAGNVNRVGSGISCTTSWERVSTTVVVPSGMTVRGLYIASWGGMPAVKVSGFSAHYGASMTLAATSQTSPVTKPYVDAAIGAVPSTGTANGGTWWKFPGGLMVCTKQLAVSTSCNSGWASHYETPAISLGSMPATFAAVPTISIANVSGNAAFAENVKDATASSWGSTYLCRPNSVDTLSVTLHLMAIGTWK